MMEADSPPPSLMPGDEAAGPLRFRHMARWHLLILAGITVQYVVSWLLAPEGMEFVGALQNPDDISSYVAAMRQGAAGGWLFEIPFSPESWQPRLMLLPYLMIGKATALIAQPGTLWFHLWRLLFSCFTLWCMVSWVNTVLRPHARWQRSAWFLIWFGGGISWFIVLFQPSVADWVPDIGLPEWSPTSALFNSPHFALGLGLEALTFTCLLRALEKEGADRWRWSFLGSFLGVLSALTYVYHLATILATIGMFVVAGTVRSRKLSWSTWAPSGIVALPLLPLAFYYQFYTNGDPYWIWLVRYAHEVPPPSLAGTFSGLGILAPLAIAGGWYWMKHGRPLLLPAWAAANLILLYLPLVGYRGRFALGLLVPIATLAAVGLESVLLPYLARRKAMDALAGVTSTPYATLRRIILILAVPSVVMNLLLYMKGPRAIPDFPFYLPQADVAAASWLGNNSGESAITMAYYPLGNFLPAVYDGKVFLGHMDFTPSLQSKLALFEQFWDVGTPQVEREAFLERWGITHLFVGRYETTFIDEGVRPLGDVVYDVDGVTIYRVNQDVER